jgi:hypothetical protein
MGRAQLDDGMGQPRPHPWMPPARARCKVTPSSRTRSTADLQSDEKRAGTELATSTRERPRAAGLAAGDTRWIERGYFTVEQLPDASFAEATSNSRSFMSLPPTSTPFGGASGCRPASGPSGGAGFASLELARQLDDAASNVTTELTLTRARQFVRRGARCARCAGGATRSSTPCRGVREDELVPAPTPVPTTPPLPSSWALRYRSR